MTLDLLFQFQIWDELNKKWNSTPDVIGIKIENKSLWFADIKNGWVRTTPFGYTKDGKETVRLDYGGIIKEFPDLKDLSIDEAKKESVRRLTLKLKGMSGDEEIKQYLKEDLRKHGYKLLFTRKNGFRTVKEKEDVN